MSDAPTPDAPAPDGAVPPTDPSDPSDPPLSTPEPTPSAPSLRSWLIAGAVAAVVALGIGFVVSRGDGSDADPVAAADAGTAGDQTTGVPGGPGGFGGAFGTVTGIDGTTLTVESADLEGETSEVTVEVDDDTQLLEATEGDLADVVEGDEVTVIGEQADGGEVEATAVVVGDQPAMGGFPGGGAGELPEDFEPPADGELPEGFELPEGAEPPEDLEPPADGEAPGFAGGATAGTVVSVGSTGFTLETVEGETVTIVVGEDTTVSVTEQIALDDLAEGDEVQVQGDADDDGVVAADVVRVGELGGGFPGGAGGPGGAGAAGAGDDAGEDV